MKFSEFIDRLLVRLYELDQAEGDHFFDLNAVAREMKESVPSGWVFDAAKVLETRAFANCIFTFGATLAKLTGEGRLYVEEGRGSTRDVQQRRADIYVTISGGINQVVTGNNTGTLTQSGTLEKERQPAFELVEQMLKLIDRDAMLPSADKEEARTYANLLKIQLRKPESDRSLLSSVLDNLGRISSLAEIVVKLMQLFNATTI